MVHLQHVVTHGNNKCFYSLSPSTDFSMSLIAVTVIFTCWQRSQQAWILRSAWIQKATSHGCTSSLSTSTRVAFNSCRAAATSFTLPSTAWKKDRAVLNGGTAGEDILHPPVYFLLLYLPVHQCLTKQSLTGELFPLIQLLFLLHYQTMKMLQPLLSVCTSVMYLFNSANLRGQIINLTYRIRFLFLD